MAEIRRLHIANPAANTPTLTFNVSSFYLLAVIAANKSSNDETRISVWLAPNDTATESEWGYIVKDLQIDPSDSFETFRFPAVANDYLYVMSDNGNVSFTTVGINQVEA